jgi:hypothetical protein
MHPVRLANFQAAQAFVWGELMHQTWDPDFSEVRDYVHEPRLLQPNRLSKQSVHFCQILQSV